ncbi:hypothetical protein GGI43DRAFT_336826 [Trichoderma evansii]
MLVITEARYSAGLSKPDGILQGGSIKDECETWDMLHRFACLYACICLYAGCLCICVNVQLGVVIGVETFNRNYLLAYREEYIYNDGCRSVKSVDIWRVVTVAEMRIRHHLMHVLDGPLHALCARHAEAYTDNTTTYMRDGSRMSFVTSVLVSAFIRVIMQAFVPCIPILLVDANIASHILVLAAAQLPDRATRRHSRQVGVTVGSNVCLDIVWWYRRWVCAGAEEASKMLV